MYQLVLACILNLQFCKIWYWDQTVRPSGLNPLKHFIHILCTKDVYPQISAGFTVLVFSSDFQPKQKAPLFPAEVTLLLSFSFFTSIFPYQDAQTEVVCLPNSVNILNFPQQQPGWNVVRTEAVGVCYISVSADRAGPKAWLNHWNDSHPSSWSLLSGWKHCTPLGTGLTAELLGLC